MLARQHQCVSRQHSQEASRLKQLVRHMHRIGDDGGVRWLKALGAKCVLGERSEARISRGQRPGLADQIGPAQWVLKPEMEAILRELGDRGDIIKTMHRAMTRAHRAEPDAFTVHQGTPADPITGRLVERGLHDELAGTAYTVIEGVDGHTHHVRFDDIEMTGDAKPGAIVELRTWRDARGGTRLSLATRSDLTLAEQVTASGATWLDRQLVTREPMATAGGFGEQVRDALRARADHLVGNGLASRQGDRLVIAPGLIDTLRSRDLAQAAARIAERSGLPYQPSAPGEHVSGLYRERVTLASGRFAMIDDGLGFQLVPWRPALDQQLGRQITGTMTRGGGVDWQLGRGRGLGR